MDYVNYLFIVLLWYQIADIKYSPWSLLLIIIYWLSENSGKIITIVIIEDSFNK